jgi:DNA-binding GntR family transcriptional regulator
VYERVVGDGALSDAIVEEIQRRILSGVIPVGSWIRHAAVAEEFGVSRTPVREALRVLDSKGVVTIVRNRGARVNGPSPAQIRESGLVAAELAGYAAFLAASRMDDGQLQRMVGSLNDFEALLSTCIEDPALSQTPEANDRWSVANACFHGVIVDAASNQQLKLTIDELSRRLPRDSSYAAYSGNSRLLKRNFAEHRAVADAILAEDPQRARKKMAHHIRSSTEALARHYEQLEVRPPSGLQGAD